MDFKAGLWQQQTLKLTMTQELSQAIALLQFSAQELNTFLENKAAENPLIQLEVDHVKTMDPRIDHARMKRKRTEKDDKNWIDQIGEQVTTLEEHLLSQLAFRQISDEHMKIISHLIREIDENGYLSFEDTELATTIEKDALVSPLEESIQILQRLEPPGIAARNLQECLLLQLQRLPLRNELAEIIIESHFLDFAEKRWKEITKVLKVSLKEIQDVFDYIQQLNPRPGAAYRHEKSVYIAPDVIIQNVNGDIEVSVFDGLTPSIQFNRSYYNKMSDRSDQQVQRFLQEKSQDFQWMAKSLEQRKETIMKVTMKIVEKQQDYFLKGSQYLKPMTMKEVAEELAIHESTVSRAVREKYAQTPYGTVELKTFFSSTIQTVTNENTSSAQVKNQIQKMIDKENKQKPLSDQEIVEILKEDGMVISRRTVAKYRDQLGIQSSSKRKRYE